jgi:hypothetical protein
VLEFAHSLFWPAVVQVCRGSYSSRHQELSFFDSVLQKETEQQDAGARKQVVVDRSFKHTDRQEFSGSLTAIIMRQRTTYAGWRKRTVCRGSFTKQADRSSHSLAVNRRRQRVEQQMLVQETSFVVDLLRAGRQAGRQAGVIIH